MITFDVMTADDAEKIRRWRNQSLETLRTPFPLTIEQQQEWYNAVVCDRNANARWYSIILDKSLIGYTGIENISWYNRNGEISLLISPELQGNGYGTEAAEKILEIGFNQLNLNCIYGECYLSNPSIKFWEKLVDKYEGEMTVLPARKYIDGDYVSSLYFSIMKEGYEDCMLYSSPRG